MKTIITNVDSFRLSGIEQITPSSFTRRIRVVDAAGNETILLMFAETINQLMIVGDVQSD